MNQINETIDTHGGWSIKYRDKMKFKKLSKLITASLILDFFLISMAIAEKPRDIAKKTFPSVVMLVMEDDARQPLSLESGFFVREDIVVTNLQVVDRIAHCAAYLAPNVFSIHGAKEFGVRIITCKSLQGIKSWAKLERALLLGFREKHGDVPKCNSQGAKIREKDEFQYFRRSRIRQILTDLEEVYRRR